MKRLLAFAALATLLAFAAATSAGYFDGLLRNRASGRAKTWGFHVTTAASRWDARVVQREETR